MIRNLFQSLPSNVTDVESVHAGKAVSHHQQCGVLIASFIGGGSERATQRREANAWTMDAKGFEQLGECTVYSVDASDSRDSSFVPMHLVVYPSVAVFRDEQQAGVGGIPGSGADLDGIAQCLDALSPSRIIALSGASAALTTSRQSCAEKSFLPRA